MKKRSKTFRYYPAYVLLTLLFLTSVILLSSRLAAFSAKEKPGISLTQGAQPELSKEARFNAAQQLSGKTADSAVSLLNHMSQGTGTTIYKVPTVVSSHPDMDTVDENRVQWETLTAVDLFKSAYTNESGALVVKSENGDKVIAPGTSGSYVFSVKNTGNISLDYVVRTESLFHYSDKKIPLLARLRREGEWKAGSATEWIDPDTLDGFIDRNTVKPGASVSYYFEWSWPFTADDPALMAQVDSTDTYLGNQATVEQLDFILNIYTLAEITPGATPEGSGESGNPTGDSTVIWPWVVMAAVSALLLILLMIFKKKTDARDTDEPVEKSTADTAETPTDITKQ